MPHFLYPAQIDRHLNWPPGTALRLVRRQQLPHYVLPDGSIRLRLEEVASLIRKVSLPKATEANLV
jgi:hypothetical protein